MEAALAGSRFVGGAVVTMGDQPRMRRGSGKGKAYVWLLAHLHYEGEECLIWPFSRPNGYGMLGHFGNTYYAHRLMCEWVNGPAPSERHEAAHNCGNGDKGCVHPKHVAWKTPSENQADRAEHGTKNRGRLGELTPEQRAQIRALRGIKTQEEIAAMFGTTRSNVCHIQRGKHGITHPKGYLKVGRRYHARVSFEKKYIKLGIFDTPEEATAAFRVARDRIQAGQHPIQTTID
ncbi:MAG TPA: HNH endonuclease [Nitrospira sp.]|nr:HNH endonuclease [Nitrospira sp.]